MSRLRITKAELALRKQQLAGYQRALPSLELKRQQLVIDLAAAQATSARLAGEAERLIGRAGDLGFAADEDVAIAPLIALAGVTRGSETRLGILLPVIDRIEWAPLPPPDAYPPWVDAAIGIARALAEARLRHEVAEARADRLDQALRKTIQRINLLQQILMPQAKRDIAKIGTFLADAQRMAIARTKLAVARRAAAGGYAR